MLTRRTLVGTTVRDVTAGGVVVVEVVRVEPAGVSQSLAVTVLLNTEVQVRSTGITRVTQLTDDGIRTDRIASSHRDRTRHEMGILGGVVVVTVAIDIMLDVHVAAPGGISIRVNVGTVAVLDLRHHARSGGVDVVAFIPVEVETRVRGGNGATITVVPGTTVDFHVVVVDRQDEGTVGVGLGVGQEGAQGREEQSEQMLAHGSFLWLLSCRRTILLPLDCVSKSEVRIHH